MGSIIDKITIAIATLEILHITGAPKNILYFGGTNNIFVECNIR